MRIVTRPDFDGIVCAVIILESLEQESAIIWVEPGQIQNGSAEIKSGDIMANLPFDQRCSVWFDHHVSNSLERHIEGSFKIAPSAQVLHINITKKRGRSPAILTNLSTRQTSLMPRCCQWIRCFILKNTLLFCSL